MASSSYSNSPCAACKFLRRKCMPDCIFSPYFPPEEPQKFANVHKIFGASNVSKLLNEVQPHQREDAVNSLAYEAEAQGSSLWLCWGNFSAPKARGGGGGSSLGQSPGYYYPSPWNNDPLGDGYHRGDNI
ncbi:Protein LATERAL ORGAN BOUNDARIES [Glycine soja]|uniref:Protein LATERAL ORGAN BOUNDARIES n=1 Tax=Glycine soja TaxID=3848 RepID=A0A0B2R616_GLYSO|nr:Protein LATERAL ORGAN BOUNDARIES [Glycine soja]